MTKQVISFAGINTSYS